MDAIVDNVTEQYREHQRSAARDLGFRRLLPINTDTYPEEAFQLLWEAVSKADYAFEDTTRGNKVAFIQGMLTPGTYNFEIPGEIFAQLTLAGKDTNSMIHFITLSVGPTAPLIDAAYELLRFAFDVIEVHRISAYIPAFNQKVIRLSTLLKMKFEGQMRKAFLYNEEWWDLHLYGLLDNEWKRRG